jgi:hypothetical protein
MNCLLLTRSFSAARPHALALTLSRHEARLNRAEVTAVQLNALIRAVLFMRAALKLSQQDHSDCLATSSHSLTVILARPIYRLCSKAGLSLWRRNCDSIKKKLLYSRLLVETSVRIGASSTSATTMRLPLAMS